MGFTVLLLVIPQRAASRPSGQTPLISRRQKTQTQLAHVLDVQQAAVSRIERRADMYISTLHSYIEAMGARLEIVATLRGRCGSLDATGRGEPSSGGEPGHVVLNDEATRYAKSARHNLYRARRESSAGASSSNAGVHSSGARSATSRVSAYALDLVGGPLRRVRRVSNVPVQRPLKQSQVAQAVDRRLPAIRREDLGPLAGRVLGQHVLHGGWVRLGIDGALASLRLQPRKHVPGNLAPLAPGTDRPSREVALEAVVAHVYGAKLREHGTGAVRLPVDHGLGREMADALQQVGVEGADHRVAEGDDGGELQQPNKVVVREPAPRGEEDRRHLPGPEQIQLPDERPGRRPVDPVPRD